jgi:probable HAF family extracellular repeat protein
VGLIASAASLLFHPLTASCQNYAVKDLGRLVDLSGQSQSKPNAINSRGNVAAVNVVSGSYRGLIYGSSTTNLGTLGGTNSFGAGINTSNLVVGYSLTSDGSDHAFLWTPGGTNGVSGNPQMKDLGTLGGLSSEAYAINRLGVVTGFSSDGNNDHAFVYSNAVMKDIGNLMGGSLPGSYGYGINDQGHVAGIAYNQNYSTAHAFFYNGATVTDLGTLGGTGGIALSVNNGDRVAGYATTSTGFSHAFRWASGVMTDLGTLGGGYSYGIGINNSNVVVGGSYTDGANSIYRAFICPTNTMLDLNTQLDATGTGWALVEARAINDGGQIVGVGTYGGSSHGFLLNPVPRILQQPTNVSVACQTTAGFSVTATPAPLTYQWYHGATSNGVPLVNATNASLILTNATGAQAGPYFVVLSGLYAGTTSSIASLTILDSTPPVLIGCPSNISKNTDPGVCSAIVTWTNPTALDACDGPVAVTCSPPSGSRFNKGVTIVSCTTSDSNKNTNTCFFTVTVADREAPVIANCPVPITRLAAPGSNSVVVSWSSPTATDNCDGVVLVSSLPASGSSFPIGTNTVLCRAYDSSGNTNTCTFTVTVKAAQPPLITTIKLAGTNVLLTFTTQAGGQYYVEAEQSLSGAGWTYFLPGISGTGGLVTVTNVGGAGLSSRFYRVKLTVP